MSFTPSPRMRGEGGVRGRLLETSPFVVTSFMESLL
jgi:hypothetical protein